jgi:phage gp45-like
MTLRSGVRDAARRAYLTITRGTLVKSDDSKKMQEVEVRGLFGERIKNVEHWHPYGFSSHAKVPQEGQGEAEVLIANIGGNASHPVIIAVADRRYRLKGLQEGEIAIHDDQGNKVHMTRNGPVVEAASGKTITHKVGSVTLVHSENGIDITGGYIKHNGKKIGSDHVHNGVQPGSGNTGFPQP